MTELEPWVKAKKIAEFCSKSVPTINKMADEKLIPCFSRKTGRGTERLFKLSAVDAALEQQSKSA